MKSFSPQSSYSCWWVERVSSWSGLYCFWLPPGPGMGIFQKGNWEAIGPVDMPIHDVLKYFYWNSGWWVAFHSACCGDFCLLSAILRLSTGWRLSWDWLWISRYVRIRTVWVISLVLKTNYHLPNGGPIVIHSEDPITLPGRAHSSNRRGCMGRSGPTWNQE